MSSPGTSSTSSSSSPSTSAFKRLCQVFSPKQSPRLSNASSSSSSSQKAFNEELTQRVFNYFDADEDGKITAAELMTCMTAVGGREMSLLEAEMAVETADSDGDGMLGLEDFLKILQNESGSEENGMYTAFVMYAAEGSDIIEIRRLNRIS
ncbi:putative calcium-binding protein CML19 [Apium graveolens]|uniref:putative calcium-binding protein CML19 n=1 Tax=Apium graveolens TaxID=4045 RepID=UPI003D792D88